jgi:hypothetical protein
MKEERSALFDFLSQIFLGQSVFGTEGMACAGTMDHHSVPQNAG